MGGVYPIIRETGGDPTTHKTMTQLTVDGITYNILDSRSFENNPTCAKVLTGKRPRGRRTYNIWQLLDGSYKVSKF